MRCVGDGFAAEVWERGSPGDEWSVGSVTEPSADKETSRDTSALMRGANQSESSEVPSSVRLVRDGIRVQGK